MFERILIGVDGRRGGRDAIALATQLSAPDADLTMAHIIGGGPNPWWAQMVWEERRFEPQAKMLAAEREAANVNAAIVCREAATPARGLHDLAVQHESDLIVVGSSRHSLLGQVLLGDDARATLSRAPCAVAIAPHQYARAPLLEIGVGSDVSPGHELALATARELVAPSEGDVTEVHGTSQELALRSSELDLLVIGCHASGLLHDGVSRYLAGHAACPLLVLPGAATGAAAQVSTSP